MMYMISAYHLQLKCMGGHFVFGLSLPESGIVLSDNWLLVLSTGIGRVDVSTPYTKT